MKHTDLLTKIKSKYENNSILNQAEIANALYRVVELHNEDVGTPGDDPLYTCDYCKLAYPCPTIQAIEKELK